MDAPHDNPLDARSLTLGPQGDSFIRIAIMISAAASPSVPVAPGVRTGDERLIKVTANAGRKVHSLLSRQGRPAGVLRVAVIGGGCSGLQYKMDLQDAPASRDILVETGGIRVVVDPKSEV